MTDVDDAAVIAIAEAVAARLQTVCPLLNWPKGRGTLNEAEAATYLGIGMDFLRQLRQEGRIPYRQIGRRIVYAAPDIARFLDDCSSDALAVQEKTGACHP